MNDFIIPAKTMKELEERTIQFLKIAEKHNLYFKRLKCDFNIEEIPILRVIVGKGKSKWSKRGSRLSKNGKHL